MAERSPRARLLAQASEGMSTTAALPPTVLKQFEPTLDHQRQWLCCFFPSDEVLAKSNGYSNFSHGRANPPPQQAPSTREQSYAALEYTAHRGLRSMLGHLIPHNDYCRFFHTVLRVARQLHKGTTHTVRLSQALVQRVFAHEREDEDIAFAATAFRRLQRLREVEGNVFTGDPATLPPLHDPHALHLIRMILPTMHTFGADHGDGAEVPTPESRLFGRD